MKTEIYLDHAATTPLKKEVLDCMEPYLTRRFWNPSSAYRRAIDNTVAIANARNQVASALNCLSEEVFFTSGGTEADNWAVKGIASAHQAKGKHIITSAIEHPAVKQSCAYLWEKGFSVTYLPVDEYGTVSVDALRAAISDDTILISVMYANNEVGTIQPIREIGEIAREHQILFHTDAVQAFGSVEIDFDHSPIDLLSLSAHKFYGPKGVGALIVRNGLFIHPLLHGGTQEHRQRAGTEHLPGIVGMGRAAELAVNDIASKASKISALRDAFVKAIIDAIPGTRLLGHPTNRLPGNANIAFEGVENRRLVDRLDANGIFVSAGSACHCRTNTASHVLAAMDVPEEHQKSAIRFSFGEDNQESEIDPVVTALRNEVDDIRAETLRYAM
jgi:cysteine desulfurase